MIWTFIVEHFRPAMGANTASSSSEKELVRRAVRGEVGAFGALYSMYHDAIYRYVYFRTGNVTVAEDLTETIFFKAWRAIDGYVRQGLAFSSWLYRIARNVMVDYYRERRDDLPLASEHLSLTEEEGLGPEEQVLKREEVKELQRAISRLSEEQQQVIILRFVEGLPHSQVAEIIGKSEEACRVIQHRGLTALSRLLDEAW